MLLVFWGAWPVAYLAISFLLGWIIKMGVTRLGGGSGYRLGKQLMIGVIAGDVLGGLILRIAGAPYYFLTSLPPRATGG
jgi:hypothetical protein